MRAVVVFVLAVPVALAASRFRILGEFSPTQAPGPFSPGGAGYILGIALFSVAACAGVARASVIKVIQRPCGTRLQKLQRLVLPPPLPQPLSTPAGAERGAQQPYVANALFGVAFTRRGQHSNVPGTPRA